MSKIDQLQEQFQEVHKQSLAVGKELAESIDMLSIGEVRESIATAIVEMESLTQTKSSILTRIPWAGKYVAKAKDAAKTEMLQSGKMVETVDRLFATLKKKNDNVMEVMERIYNIREHVTQYVNVLETQKVAAQDFLEEEGDTFEAQKARNLLVQITPSIVKANDRLAVMTGTLNSAQVASQAISGMLPALQGELQTELAIKASMNELKEFKEIFDSTLELVDELNYANNKQIQDTVLEVNQLAIQNPRNLKRLEQNQIERDQMHKKLAEQTAQARSNQEKALIKLEQIHTNQQLTLGHKSKD